MKRQQPRCGAGKSRSVFTLGQGNTDDGSIHPKCVTRMEDCEYENVKNLSSSSCIRRRERRSKLKGNPSLQTVPLRQGDYVIASHASQRMTKFRTLTPA